MTPTVFPKGRSQSTQFIGICTQSPSRASRSGGALPHSQEGATGVSFWLSLRVLESMWSRVLLLSTSDMWGEGPATSSGRRRCRRRRGRALRRLGLRGHPAPRGTGARCTCVGGTRPHCPSDRRRAGDARCARPHDRSRRARCRRSRAGVGASTSGRSLAPSTAAGLGLRR